MNVLPRPRSTPKLETATKKRNPGPLGQEAKLTKKLSTERAVEFLNDVVSTRFNNDVNILVKRVVKDDEPIQPRENIFLNEGEMQATITPPEQLDAKRAGVWNREDKMPLVVIVHGISAHSRMKLLMQLSGMLEHLGVPTMRVNMQDNPQNPFKIRRKAAFLSRAVDEALDKNPWIDQRRILFVGHSQGGLVIRRALRDVMNALAKRKSYWLRGVATISSPPHLKEYPAALRYFADAHLGGNLPESYVPDAEDLQPDGLHESGLPQVHYAQLGDEMLPLHRYRALIPARTLRIIPNIRTWRKNTLKHYERTSKALREAFALVGLDSEKKIRSEAAAAAKQLFPESESAVFEDVSLDGESKRLVTEFKRAGALPQSATLTHWRFSTLAARSLLEGRHLALQELALASKLREVGERNGVKKQEIESAEGIVKNALAEALKPGRHSLHQELDVNRGRVAFPKQDDGEAMKELLRLGVEGPAHNWADKNQRYRLFRSLIPWVCDQIAPKNRKQMRLDWWSANLKTEGVRSRQTI